MTRKIIAKFWCEMCQKTQIKELAIDIEENNFPYEMGWFELNSFNMVAPKRSGTPVEIEFSNKDFCSRDCAINYIEQALLQSETKVQEPKAVPTEPIPTIPQRAEILRPEQPQKPEQKLGAMGHPLSESYDNYTGKPYDTEELDSVPELGPKKTEEPKKRFGFFKR